MDYDALMDLLKLLAVLFACAVALTALSAFGAYWIAGLALQARADVVRIEITCPRDLVEACRRAADAAAAEVRK